MGVNGLYNALKAAVPDAAQPCSLETYRGQSLAVDISIIVYQIVKAYQLTNSAGVVTNHIRGVATIAKKFDRAGVKPVFVFDGRPHELKTATLAKRKATASGNPLPPNAFADVWRVLTSLGHVCIQAEGEGEAACAALCQAGQCAAVVTEDSDALLFGADVLRGLTRAKDTPTCWSITRVLAGLKMTQAQFIHYAVLLGTDYSPRVYGPVTALKKHQQAPANPEVEEYYAQPATHLPLVYDLTPPAKSIESLREWFTLLEFSPATIEKILS